MRNTVRVVIAVATMAAAMCARAGTDMVLTLTPGRQVVLTPLKVYPDSNSVAYDRSPYTCDGSGQVRWTNMTVGLYSWTAQWPPDTTTQPFIVPTNHVSGAGDWVRVEAKEVATPQSVTRPQDYPYSSTAMDAILKGYAVVGSGGLSFAPQPAAPYLSNYATIPPSSLVTTGGGFHGNADTATSATSSGTALAVDAGVTNAWRGDIQSSSSNLNASALGAGTVPLARLSNINSNNLDAATKAQLALAGTGGSGGSPQTNISYAAVTNAPWLTGASNIALAQLPSVVLTQGSAFSNATFIGTSTYAGWQISSNSAGDVTRTNGSAWSVLGANGNQTNSGSITASALYDGNGRIGETGLPDTIWGSRVIYVDATNGNDSFTFGTSNSPLKTIALALEHQEPGDVIVLRNGYYLLTSNYVLKAGLALVGVGSNYVTVDCKAPLLAYGPTIHLGDDCYIAGMTLRSANGTNYGASIGGYDVGSYVLPNAIKSVFHNALVENVHLIGESDCFFNRNTNTCTAAMVSCVVSSRWDCVAMQDGRSRLDCFNCTFIAKGTNITADGSYGNKKHCLYLEAYGTIRTFGCHFEADGKVGFVAEILGSAVSATNLFYSCTWTTNLENVGIFAPADFVGGAGAFMYWFGGQTLDPSRVDPNEDTEMVFEQVGTDPYPNAVTLSSVLSRNYARKKALAVLAQ